MGASTLFPYLFQHKARANEELFAAVAALETHDDKEAMHAAIRTLNHVYVVDRIFRAHLLGEAHGYTATNTAETPPLAALGEAVRETDRWYLEYARHAGPEELAQAVDVHFTDGKRGRMSREEILAHIVTHGSYHRGAVGRILDQQSLARPADGLPTFLHAAEPERRIPGASRSDAALDRAGTRIG